jgi:hypothetical protein
MTDQSTIPDAGALEGTSPAPARTSSPAPQPAARTSPTGQHELDRAGAPRWNAPPDPTGERARWDASERKRLGIPDPAAATAKPGQTDKPADGTTHKFGDTTVSEQKLREFLANKGARESGRLQAPETTDGYKVELPASFKAPLGVEVALNEADPAFGQLRAWAHSHAIDQSAFSDLLGVYAGHQASQLAIGKFAYESEVAKLGAAGPGRIDALATWLRGTLGDEGKILSGVRDAKGNVHGGILWTAQIVGALEKMMNNQRSQGAASYSGNNRDMGNHDAGKIPGYDKMDFAQRRHAQEQLRQQRGR